MGSQDNDITCYLGFGNDIKNSNVYQFPGISLNMWITKKKDTYGYTLRGNSYVYIWAAIDAIKIVSWSLRLRFGGNSYDANQQQKEKKIK